MRSSLAVGGRPRIRRRVARGDVPRHQFDTLFGERLNDPEMHEDGAPIWRVDWTSELSTSSALGSDFDFKRHIVNGRVRMLVGNIRTSARVRSAAGRRVRSRHSASRHRRHRLRARLRLQIRERDTLALMNLEYEIGWKSGPSMWRFSTQVV